LEFFSSDERVTLTKKEESLAETIYSIRIADALDIGFTSSEQHVLSKEFANLILAFNILLKRTCITYRKSEFSSINVAQIVLKFTDEVRSVVRKTSDGFHALINEEPIRISDDVRIAVKISEKLDILPLIPLFKRIQQTQRFESSTLSSLYDFNLANSLKNYEIGSDPFIFVLQHVHRGNMLLNRI
jgi:hypothetical protein